MSEDDDLRIRPGRIRSPQSQRVRPFINQALAATQRAGGRVSRTGRTVRPRGSRFGRGKLAAVIAQRGVSSRSRNVVVTARVVRHRRTGATLADHLAYLRRDGVSREGEKGRLFGAEGDNLDAKAFADRCDDDRHHFRFIVSPEDAVEMADLKAFTRTLMTQAEKDLDTRLDWVAVEHWNTGQPHVHVIVRGVADDGGDLVIARDYISDGMRNQARILATLELGLRTELEMRRTLERQVDADRWTDLDRALRQEARGQGVIDMAPPPDRAPDPDHALKMGRLRKLEGLGLAQEVGPGQWVMAEDAETVLKDLGERGDIIKRIHRSLAERGIARAASSYVLEAETLPGKLVGRLVDRGLHDELEGTAYAIVDGVDGRAHHLHLPDLDATGDGRAGSIVELRRFEDRQGNPRVALAVRSDLPLKAQITAPGATWLDRRNLSSDGRDLGGGFGREVGEAMAARAEHLVGEGLARRQGQRIVFARDLLETLRRQELAAVGKELSNELGLPQKSAQPGDYVAGTVRQRLMLSSGRYALLDDGLGFSLVPWSPSLDRQLGKSISGVARADGGVNWDLGRKRGLGL